MDCSSHVPKVGVGFDVRVCLPSMHRKDVVAGRLRTFRHHPRSDVDGLGLVLIALSWMTSSSSPSPSSLAGLLPPSQCKAAPSLRFACTNPPVLNKSTSSHQSDSSSTYVLCNKLPQHTPPTLKLASLSSNSISSPFASLQALLWLHDATLSRARRLSRQARPRSR